MLPLMHSSLVSGHLTLLLNLTGRKLQNSGNILQGLPQEEVSQFPENEPQASSAFMYYRTPMKFSPFKTLWHCCVSYSIHLPVCATCTDVITDTVSLEESSVFSHWQNNL